MVDWALLTAARALSTRESISSAEGEPAHFHGKAFQHATELDMAMHQPDMPPQCTYALPATEPICTVRALKMLGHIWEAIIDMQNAARHSITQQGNALQHMCATQTIPWAVHPGAFLQIHPMR